MIFVDTWAWVTLADRSDAYHQRAKDQHQAFVREGRQYVTSDHVMAETITFLYDALPPSKARAFVQTVLDGADAGNSDSFISRRISFIEPGK